MSILLVGFDSAWPPGNSGACVAVLREADGHVRALGAPIVADFEHAAARLRAWQAEFKPEATIQMLDQPTIVPNAIGQRPVENIVSCPVSRRYGGMQPASRARTEMFGENAPIWPYLEQFGGPANPFDGQTVTGAFETYPVLVMIALGWVLPDRRSTGRLPKYNPTLRAKFSMSDWAHVCQRTAAEFAERGLMEIVTWLLEKSTQNRPKKQDQDGVDACICLLCVLRWAEGQACLTVGDLESGNIIVPDSPELRRELETRCWATGRKSEEWVRLCRLKPMPNGRSSARLG